ncbi:hypothetical protein HT746_06690 [Burkholderia pyrrocinia]|uniref:hypothetical protein n=1 Tax=Burkholderia pyrrocinia TaxID=60550 RepID=UPI00157627E6|nr:hypothetical protein [Burkholderia pyrrocinia]NTX26821.1 hypothetical protein [Burkholderia pyrrocinia]
MNTTGRTRSHAPRHRAILSAGPGRWRRTILVLLVVLIGYAAADQTPSPARDERRASRWPVLRRRERRTHLEAEVAA